jgi:nucleoside-diphosphate-sugar epimerase
MTRTLIIGGSGTISTITVEDLLVHGHEIAIFNRGKTKSNFNKSVKTYIGDRNVRTDLKLVIDEFVPDVIIDFICFNIVQAKEIIDLCYKRVKHFIFISTVDTYGYPITKLPAEENKIYNNPVSEYAKQKLECEKIFMSHHHNEGFPITIVRPVYSLGPRFLLSIFSRNAASLINRIKEDKHVIVPGDGTTLIQPSDAKDTGRMVALLAGETKAFGKIYNCGSPQFISQEEYIQLIAKEVGKKANIVHIPTDFMLGLKNLDIRDSLLHELTRFNLVYSLERFKEDFPEFCWKNNISDGIAQYIKNVEKGVIQVDDSFEIEDIILTHWLHVTKEWVI